MRPLNSWIEHRDHELHRLDIRCEWLRSRIVDKLGDTETNTVFSSWFGK
jgi:hypothetical protein